MNEGWPLTAQEAINFNVKMVCFEEMRRLSVITMNIFKQCSESLKREKAFDSYREKIVYKPLGARS